MSTYADDIKRIAREKENPGGLGLAQSRPSISGSTKVMNDVETEENVNSLVAPLTLEILTYDDAEDVLIEANNGDFTIKTVETAKITDANGNEYPIDTITYATP